MNFLLDNNLPPSLAQALNILSENEGHAVFHLTSKFPRNTPDVIWVSTLSQEGEWVIVSQDQFSKGDLEKRAFRESGLLIFCLAKHWSGENYWNKAHNLVRWWPAILAQSERITGGGAFRVPWRYGSKGKFEQIKI